jgi:integrase
MKNFKFFLRKQGKSDPVIVFQIFDARFKGRKFMYSTGIHSAPADWDKKKEQSKLYHINKHLRFISDTARGYLEQRVRNSTLSRKDLKEYLVSQLKDEAAESAVRRIEFEEIWTIWEHIISTSKNTKGEPISEGTKKQKRQTLKMVKKYAAEKGLSLTLSSLTIKFYHAFDAWMIEKELQPNTRGKHHKEVKAILREADDRDIPASRDYAKKSWKVIKTSPESVFLNTLEIKKVFNIPDAKLTPEDRIHRDIFVMACFVGARHSDWNKIKPENVIKEDKTELLKYKQTKTGDIIYVPIHSAVRIIWAKYPKFPKVISNQKFNDAVKRIAEAAELGTCVVNGKIVEKWTMVTTHTARRSFATNAYLSKEMEVRQIMHCTGHKTEESFKAYLKLDGRDYGKLAAESKFFTEEWSALKAV